MEDVDYTKRLLWEHSECHLHSISPTFWYGMLRFGGISGKGPNDDHTWADGGGGGVDPPWIFLDPAIG